MRSALKLRCEELGAPFSSGEFVANSGNRVTQMALVRYYSAFFQDQLQAPYIGDTYTEQQHSSRTGTSPLRDQPLLKENSLLVGRIIEAAELAVTELRIKFRRLERKRV